MHASRIQTRSSKQKLKALVSGGDYTLAMAISKLLIALLVVSLLVLQKIVAGLVKIGVPYPLGRIFAIGLAGHAVHDANVSLKALPAT
ncbi:hypothetical protein POTOM_009359 [Populus tomentosa]|uniref:Uncharacterized protein n=1 Tax=Populus tomentosa TaxID=118781 RepID=A0A8X8AFZ6_POPTO|nr:hypothetical protein POTOM_009359 [Populus tomentosa]